ncbi:K02A2.6-like, partial [Cordylochernes scorpioides]
MANFGNIEAFDPKNPEKWITYLERMNFFFLANDIVKPERRKAIFLTLIGAEIYALARSLASPKELSFVEYDNLIKLLTDHFSPKPNIIVQRFLFNKRNQGDESVSAYIAELRRLSEDCEFVDLDDRLRDKLVCGLRNESLVKRLLSEKDLTFEKALNLAICDESASADASMLQEKITEVNMIKKTSKTEPPNFKSGKVHFTDFKKMNNKRMICIRCKGNHMPNVCKFRNAKCFKCGKIGHVQMACLTNVGKSGNLYRANSNPTLCCLRREEISNPYYITANLDNHDVHMLIDSGSEYSLLNKETFLEYWKLTQLKRSEILLNTWSSSQVNILGKLYVKARLSHGSRSLQILVADGLGPNILGRQWFSAFRLKLNFLNSLETNPISPDFEELFKEEIDAYNGPLIHIDILDNAEPKFVKARTVPFALRNLVDEKLKALEEQGIIEPIKFSKWASPIVTVLKNDGTIRICHDYKTTVNLYTNPDKYPLPTIPQPLDRLRGGMKIDNKGIHPSEEKLRAIKDAKPPSNKKELMYFLGLLNYYERFLRNKATVVEPLHRLLDSNNPWKWNREHQRAFKEAKSLISSESVLAHFDDNLPILVSCDASEYGIGAILSQYLLGRTFKILTDHKPLVGIFNPKKPIPQVLSPRMLRWCLTLAAYTYTIEYKPGKVNCNADALSRLPLNECPSVVPNPSEVFFIESEHAAINSSEVAKITSKDPILSKVKFWAMNGWPERRVDDKFKDFVSKSNEISVHKDCLLWGSRVIIPEILRKDILNLLHDTHIGIVGTKALARGLCWWPKIDGDIERMISSCSGCLSCSHDPPKTDVYPWIWPSRPWSRLHIDHAGPFQGKLFLVVVDAYSKWIEAKIVSTTSTETTINSLKEIFATHGLPDVIVSDNGTSFTSELFRTFLKRNGVRHILCAPYHAASNGQVERAIQTLKNLLRKNSSGNWTTRLSRSLLSMRIAINSTTQKSPAQLLMNRNLKSLINKFHPESVSEGRMRQENKFIRNWKPHRVVNEGQAVIARGYHGPRWLPGVVQEKTGPVSIKVETDDGEIVNRHLVQVRSCGESEALPSTSSTPQVTLDFERPPAVQETDSSEGTPRPVLRRSLRIRKPPSNLRLRGLSPEGHHKEPTMLKSEPGETSAQVPSTYISLQQPRYPSTFVGDGSEDAQRWLKDYQRVAKFNRWDDSMCLANVIFFLAGTARQWYENNEDLLTSWEVFQRALGETFGQQEEEMKKAEIILKTRAQKSSESSESYMQDVLYLCQLANPLMDDETKLGHLMKGIAEDIYQILIAKDAEKVDQFLKECRKIELMKKRRITASKFERLPNVALVAYEEEDLPSMIRRIVQEEFQKVKIPPTACFLGVEQKAESAPLEDLIKREVKRELAPITRKSSFPRPQRSYTRPLPPQRSPENSEVRKTDTWRTPNDQPICFHCGRPGHVVRYCRDRRRIFEEARGRRTNYFPNSEFSRYNGELESELNRRYRNPSPYPGRGRSPKIAVISEKVQGAKDLIVEGHKDLLLKKELAIPSSVINFHHGRGDVWVTNATSRNQIIPADNRPIKQRPYRVSPTERRAIQGEVDKMIKMGVAQPSESPWSSPVVLVKNKDGSWRFCVDYRRLNRITKKDVYPIPRTDDVLDSLTGAKFYSSMDLRTGYWQIEIDEGDREKTAFVTPDGLYEFRVMPFGLCNAPATFERMMDNLLAGLKWTICLCYLDDIIVYASSFQEHMERLEKVLKCIQRAGLCLNPEKCLFGSKIIKVLGHLVSEEGIRPDPGKIEAIINFSTPKNTTDVRSFIGLCSYYRRFVRNFANKAKPLHELLKNNTRFVWSKEQDESFQILKAALTTDPLLGHYKEEAETHLHKDASGHGIGAILIQIHEGEEKPIAYASRTLNAAEKNYSTTERECLAVVWAIYKFRPYLFGKHFTVVSDHHSLCWLANIKDPSGRLARWALRLQEFDISIVYKSGKKHQDADCLSRNPLLDTHENNIPELISITDVRKEQEKDDQITKIYHGSQSKGDGDFKLIEGILYRKNYDPMGKMWLLVVSKQMRIDILREAHDSPMAGHLGFAKTYDRVRKKYFWPGMYRSVKQYVSHCRECQRRKGSTGRPPGQLVPIPPVARPFQRVGIDLLGRFPVSNNGNKWIVVATDYLSRYAMTRAIPNGSAEEVAKFMIEDVLLKHGAPRELISDRGRTFISRTLKEINDLCGTIHRFTSAYHPQTKGLTERLNKTLADMLSMYVDVEQRNWDAVLPYVTFAYNTSQQESTGFSPFYLIHGRDVETPLDTILAYRENTSLEDYVESMVTNAEDARQLARLNILRSQERDKSRYDQSHRPVHYKTGDLVWVFTPVRRQGLAEKLLKRYFGPYRVNRQLSKGEAVKKESARYFTIDRPAQCPDMQHVYLVLRISCNQGVVPMMDEEMLSSLTVLAYSVMSQGEAVRKESARYFTIDRPAQCPDMQHVYLALRISCNQGVVPMFASIADSGEPNVALLCLPYLGFEHDSIILVKNGSLSFLLFCAVLAYSVMSQGEAVRKESARYFTIDRPAQCPDIQHVYLALRVSSNQGVVPMIPDFLVERMRYDTMHLYRNKLDWNRDGVLAYSVMSQGEAVRKESARYFTIDRPAQCPDMQHVYLALRVSCNQGVVPM